MIDISSMTNKEWDLIVVGGGMTGVAAAVSARREGVENVLLIEKAGYLGGAAATSLITPFMRFYTTVDGKQYLLSRGFFTELRALMRETGAQNDKDYTIHEEYLKVALDRLAKKEGIQPLYHAMLCGVHKDGETITAVDVATKAGKLTFKARYFIDCTGDADLAAQAGCPFHLGRPDGLCQPMTLCFRVGNVDTAAFWKGMKDVQKKYKELKEAGEIKNPREDVLAFTTLDEGVIHFNTTRVVKHDPTNPFDVTEAEMIAREQMVELVEFLRKYAAGCEHCQLLYSASEIGARESRMIDGEYLLTEMDLKNCTKFEDAIAAGNYDIDIHNPEGSGTSHYFFADGTWYTIPYRSLQPKNADNLLVAGRCISSTHEAQASYRIMPIVTTLGEAAGVAVAVANADHIGVKQADVKKIQATLEKNGAFTGLNA